MFFFKLGGLKLTDYVILQNPSQVPVFRLLNAVVIRCDNKQVPYSQSENTKHEIKILDSGMTAFSCPECLLHQTGTSKCKGSHVTKDSKILKIYL